MKYKVVGLVVVIGILIAVAGSFYLARNQVLLAGLKGQITNQLANTLGCDVVVDKVEITSWNSILLSGVIIKNSDGQGIASADKVIVKVNMVAAMMGQTPEKTLSELVLENPRIALSQNSEGAWNIQPIIDKVEAEDSAFRGKCTIQDGEISITRPKEQWQLTKLDGTFDFAETPDVGVALTATADRGQLYINGTFSRQQTSSFEIKATEVDVDQVLAWSTIPAEDKPHGGKMADLAVKATFGQGKYSYEGSAQLEDTAINIQTVAAENICGLITFTEKEVHLFATVATIESQVIHVQGRVGTNTPDPEIHLAISAQQLDLGAFSQQSFLAGLADVAVDITGTASQPQVVGKVQLTEGTIAGYGAKQATVEFSLDPEKLRINHFDAAMFGGRLGAEGTVNLTDGQSQLDFRGRGIDIAALPGSPVNWSGQGDVDFHWDGGQSFTDANVAGTVKLGTGSIAGVSFDTLTGSFSKTGHYLQLDYFTLEMAGGSLVAQGSMDDGLLNMGVLWQGVPLSNLAPISEGLAISGVTQGQGRITGPVDNPTAAITFTAERGQVCGQPFATAQGTLTVAQQQLRLIDVEAINGSTRYMAQGVIGLTADRPLDVTLEAKQARAENMGQYLLPGENITGNVDAVLQIAGLVANPTIDGQVKLTDGSFRGRLITKVEGSFRQAAGITQLKQVTIAAGDDRAAVSGTIYQEGQLNLTVEAQIKNIANYLPPAYVYPVAGELDFSGNLSGSVAQPLYRGQIKSNGLVINNQDLQNIVGQMSFADKQINLADLSFSLGAGKCNFYGGWNLETGQVGGQLKAENGSIADLFALLKVPVVGVSGRLDGQIVFQGTLDNPTISLIGTLNQGKIKDVSLDHIEADIQLQNKVVTINQFVAQQGSGRLVATGRLVLDGQMEMEVGGRDLDAGLLTAWFDSGLNARGKLNFTAQVSGTTDNPAAAISLDMTDGGVGNATFDSLYGMFVLKDKRIKVDQLMITKGIYRASAYGTIPLAAIKSDNKNKPPVEEQLDLKVRLEQANLSILPLLTKEVSWAVGETTGEIVIGGTVANPMLSGGISVKNGVIKLASVASPIQKVAVDIQFVGDQIKIRDFSGNMGSGGYSLTGTVDVSGLALADYDLQMVFNQCGIESPYFKGPLNGKLQLISVENKPLLRGKLVLDNATINTPYIPDFVFPNLNIGLDINLVLGNRVHMYNPYLYDAWVRGGIKVAGIIAHPVVTGRIDINHGTVNYFQTQFIIDSGSLAFTQYGSYLPVVDLGATALLENAKVMLDVQGPLDALRLKLTSQPAMSQQQILACLTLGGRAGSPDQNRQELASILNAGLQMGFMAEAQNAFRETFGVDEIRIVRGNIGDNPYALSPPDTNPLFQEQYGVKISKYVTNRLELSYTKGVTAAGSVKTFRYDLTSKLSLTGSQSGFYGNFIGLEARFNF
jgi:translocation and assembly module TamB